jgi:YjbE family integral membrane protein
MDLSLFGFSLSGAELGAFFEVVMINIVLSGDNAIVIALAVSGLPEEQRNKGIFWGIIGATVLRLMFTAVAVQLMAVIGLILIGGLALFWVAWKMGVELREQDEEEDDPTHPHHEQKTIRQAIMQIVIADVSMSLDNVLAVAGAARQHPYILTFGLVLSIALTAIASNLIARLLDRYRFLGYIGVAIICYVAFEMVWDGGIQVLAATHLDETLHITLPQSHQSN